MKDLFPAFYSNPDEPEKLWDDAVFTLDTNALLKIFEFNKVARKEWLDGLALLKNEGRLFLSFQAAHEYHLLVEKIISHTKNAAVTKWQQPIQTFLSELKTINADSDNPLFGTSKVHDICAPFIEKTDEFSKSLESIISDWRNDYLKDVDACKLKLSEIFSGLVGDKPSTDQIAEFCRQAKDRYNQNVPPGFKDKDKLSGNPFGDVILWMQLIQFAKGAQKPLALVTYENKTDWVMNGRPRPELLNEMLTSAGVLFDIAAPDKFSGWIARKLQIPKPKSVAEAERVMQADPNDIVEMFGMSHTKKGSYYLFLTRHAQDRLEMLAPEKVDNLKERIRTLISKIPNNQGSTFITVDEDKYIISYERNERDILIEDVIYIQPTLTG